MRLAVLVALALSYSPTLTASVHANGGSVPPPPSRARCTMEVPVPHTRISAQSVVLARSTADTILAGPGLLTPEISRPNPRVFGQLLRLEQVAGRDSARLRRTLVARGSNEIVVVPWGYNPGCERSFWLGSARWTMPDSLGVFMLSLRPESLWVGYRPTFDAELASIWTYGDGSNLNGPHSAHRYADSIATDSMARQPNLSAREYFDLLLALPPSESTRDPSNFAALDQWFRSHPDARHRHPASIVFSYWAQVRK